MSRAGAPLHKGMVIADVPPVHADGPGYFLHFFFNIQHIFKVNRYPGFGKGTGIALVRRFFPAPQNRILGREQVLGNLLLGHGRVHVLYPSGDLRNGIAGIRIQSQRSCHEERGFFIEQGVKLRQHIQPVGQFNQGFQPAFHAGGRIDHRLGALEIPVPQPRLLKSGGQIGREKPVPFQVMGVGQNDVH